MSGLLAMGFAGGVADEWLKQSAEERAEKRDIRKDERAAKYAAIRDKRLHELSKSEIKLRAGLEAEEGERTRKHQTSERVAGQAHDLSRLGLTQEHDLTLQGGAQAHDLDKLNLTQEHASEEAEKTRAHQTGERRGTQAHDTAMQLLDQDYKRGNYTLGQGDQRITDGKPSYSRDRAPTSAETDPAKFAFKMRGSGAPVTYAQIMEDYDRDYTVEHKGLLGETTSVETKPGAPTRIEYFNSRVVDEQAIDIKDKKAIVELAKKDPNLAYDLMKQTLGDKYTDEEIVEDIRRRFPEWGGPPGYKARSADESLLNQQNREPADAYRGAPQGGMLSQADPTRQRIADIEQELAKLSNTAGRSAEVQRRALVRELQRLRSGLGGG